eukprot:CAMPEP_0168186346 /NCGR_PEP_ID=MMETSP0139_2-20121125/14375_1 /TAXON_ID=44445 /ORGANISM="Pseudo-nitzschia australis, Strain 10249 10 AB" /LENGTH=425 /DNA_ID=CAMNT_0008108331 /DNA_START=58 /DNA_END=1336 /DNA_ORIENTATION=-
MAQNNPLLGNRISLISKKNIRYEGVLYSINETDSTLALQNVTSFGTEGRDKSDPATAFVAPQEGVHPYLLFRGCDIKDLHVHEQQTETAATAAAAAAASAPEKEDAQADPGAAPETKSETAVAKTASATSSATDTIPQKAKTTDKNTNAADTTSTSSNDLPPPPVVRKATVPTAKKESQSNGNERKERIGSSNNNGNGHGHGNSNSQRRSNNTRRKAAAVGTGASLLNRKARGAVEGGPGPQKPEGDFDFQAKLEEFDKASGSAPKANEEDNDEAGDEIAHPQHNQNSISSSHYEKDDFFDSISCDALDKQSGLDNRLRGKQERSLNTETFGATALNSTEDAPEADVDAAATMVEEEEVADEVEEEVEEEVVEAGTTTADTAITPTAPILTTPALTAMAITIMTANRNHKGQKLLSQSLCNKDSE